MIPSPVRERVADASPIIAATGLNRMIGRVHATATPPDLLQGATRISVSYTGWGRDASFVVHPLFLIVLVCAATLFIRRAVGHANLDNVWELDCRPECISRLSRSRSPVVVIIF